MALVVDPKDVDKMLAYAAEENLEAVPVAVVTESPRLVLNGRGKTIVDLSRAFLDTNGAHQETTVTVEVPTSASRVSQARMDVFLVRWVTTSAAGAIQA